MEDDKGKWFLNSTEDTVFFDVPKNPLYGRYKVKFYKDYDNLKFKMKLSNDSTVLICSKSIICSSTSAMEYLKDY
ncbi:MAG TPA: hypothetical protein VFK73_04085 [Paludibacter sp.]|nr:hypothetical protein [Paludibacter sp.]